MADQWVNWRGVWYRIHGGTPDTPGVKSMMHRAYGDLQNLHVSCPVPIKRAQRLGYQIQSTPDMDVVHLFPTEFEEKRRRKIEIPREYSNVHCAFDVYGDIPGTDPFLGIVVCLGNGFDGPYEFVPCELFDYGAPTEIDNKLYPNEWIAVWDWPPPAWEYYGFDITAEVELFADSGTKYNLIPCDSFHAVCGIEEPDPLPQTTWVGGTASAAYVTDCVYNATPGGTHWVQHEVIAYDTYTNDFTLPWEARMDNNLYDCDEENGPLITWNEGSVTEYWRNDSLPVTAGGGTNFPDPYTCE